MKRKHYLITHNGQEIMKGDVYELSKKLGKNVETIRKSVNGYINYNGLGCKIIEFKHLFQFKDNKGIVVFEGTLDECAEEMLYSKSYIIYAACNNTKVDNYTVKEVEYLEGYGYYE